MKIVKPSKLNPGDTIGIVASSLPVLPEFKDQYERGKKLIEDMGYKICEGKTVSKKRWWMAGTPKEVADDINNMFADKKIKAIMAQTGGYSSMSVLELLDYELITHNPKPFIGMSDMTAYQMAIFTKTGQIGFYMDDVSFGFGRKIKEGQENYPKLDADFFSKFLTKTTPPGVIKPITEWEVWREGKAKGVLIGGILQHLKFLSGTEYFPKVSDFDGAILFWEEIGESLSQISESLYKLKYMGVLEKISGMLIGKIKYIKRFREESIEDPTSRELIMEILKDYKFPVLAKVDFGHEILAIPMPTGVKVSFDTNKLELDFLESAVV